MGRKRAVLVGINYSGRNDELMGCLNDVNRMRGCLVDRFGFAEDDIRVLVDADPSGPQPTGANIRAALAELVEGARPGDFLFFHYSGHGTRLPAETDQDDDTGYDECIVPCDGNLIPDQDIKELVQKVPDGCLFTLVCDSCHSGGLLEKAKEQIGNSTKKNQPQHGERDEPFYSCTGFCSLLTETVRRVLETIGHQSGKSHRDTYAQPAAHARIKNRSMPLSTVIEMLKEKTRKDDIDVGSIRMSLFDHFGQDASPKIKKFVKVMMGRLQHGQHGGVMGSVGARAQEFLKAKLESNGEADALKPAMEQEVHSVEEVYAGTKARGPINGVLISACQTDQTSADATTPAGVSYGALSNAVQTILAGAHVKVTNKELVLRAREMLSKQGYTQQPGLYCGDEHADVAFIC